MSTIELGRGKFIRLISVGGWEYCERVVGTGVVVIVPIIDDKIVLISQLRHALQKKVIELPAGLVGDVKGEESEGFLVAAARELEEETGYRAEKLRYLTEGPTSSGLTSETVKFFLATGLKKVGKGGGDDSEDIDIHLVPLAQLDTWIKGMVDQGYAIDPKVFTGVYFAEKENAR